MNNNGGFHIFKTNRVTISFYPGTRDQTLSIQGADRNMVKKKILHLIGEDEDVRELQQIQDGVTENRSTGEEKEEEEEEEEEEEPAPTEEDSDVSDDNREVDINGKVFGSYTAEEERSCFGCFRNNKLLPEMDRRISSIEEILGKSFSQNQYKLLARIKQLEEERDSLLKSLPLLRHSK